MMLKWLRIQLMSVVLLSLPLSGGMWTYCARQPKAFAVACLASVPQLLAVCSMQKAVSVVKKTNAYWRALETGARKNTEDKVLARK